MIDFRNAVQGLEGTFNDLQFIWTSPEILPWSTSIVLLLIFSSIVWTVRRRRQAAVTEWRRTLAARARA
jgi:hypothetical protein